MDTVCIKMYGRTIQNIKSEKRLGHLISSRGSLVNLEPVIRDMKVKTNVITHQFYNTSWQSKVLFFNSHCMSLYGCQLWNLDDPRVEELSVAWRVCCRRLLALHPRTRSHLLPHIMNCLLVRHIIEKRMLCFFIRGLKHLERQISQFFKNVLLSNSSYMLSNVNSILQSSNIKYYEIFYCNINSLIGKVRCLEYRPKLAYRNIKRTFEYT